MAIFIMQEILDQEMDYMNKLFSDGVDGIKADAKEEVITLDGWYHVYAHQCKSKESLLSWITHLSCKKWVTREHIYWFIKIMSAWNGINPDV